MFHRIKFILLIVSSLSCNVNRFAVCFQSVMKIARRSTQNASCIKHFLRLHIIIKPWNKKNKHNKFFIMFKRNSVNVHWNILPRLALQIWQKWEPASRWGDFGIFFKGFAKSPRVLRSSWILNECNLYCKTVKYCILSEVCITLSVW